jgi:hypothetical protein
VGAWNTKNNALIKYVGAWGSHMHFIILSETFHFAEMDWLTIGKWRTNVNGKMLIPGYSAHCMNQISRTVCVCHVYRSLQSTGCIFRSFVSPRTLTFQNISPHMLSFCQTVVKYTARRWNGGKRALGVVETCCWGYWVGVEVFTLINKTHIQSINMMIIRQKQV